LPARRRRRKTRSSGYATSQCSWKAIIILGRLLAITLGRLLVLAHGRTFRAFLDNVLQARFLLFGEQLQQLRLYILFNFPELLLLFLGELQHPVDEGRQDLTQFERRRTFLVFEAFFVLGALFFVGWWFVFSVRRLRQGGHHKAHQHKQSKQTSYASLHGDLFSWRLKRIGNRHERRLN
jgi:hypothetical protein